MSIMKETVEEECLNLESVLEIDLVAREILKYLTLSDLQNCALVNHFWNSLCRAHMRDNLICIAKLRRRRSTCKSLAALEADLEQMPIVPCSGLEICINRCRKHKSSASSDDDTITQQFPNILNRINVKHLCLHLDSLKACMCWLGFKLVEKLLQLNCDTIKHLNVTSNLYDPELDLIWRVQGKGFQNLRILEVNWHCFTYEGDFPAFLSSCPNLREIITRAVNDVPLEARNLIQTVVIDDSRGRRSWINDSFDLVQPKQLAVLNCIFTDEKWYVPMPEKEKVIRNGTESLEVLVVRGPEFPLWSHMDIALVRLKYLQIVFPLDDPHFLRELNHLTGMMMPNLKVLHLQHSSCNASHIVEPIEDKSLLMPNQNVQVLKMEGFDLEMGTLMEEFKAYFPEVKELHVVDCNGSTFEHVFQWKLESLVAGAVKTYWRDNFDHILVGAEPLGAEGSSSPATVFSFQKSRLNALQNLRKLYVIGGPEKPDPNAFLSEPAAIQLLDGSMLVFKLLPGYNGSILEHLLPMDNGFQNPWCPPFPTIIEQYFDFWSP